MSSNDAPPAPNYQPIADAQMMTAEFQMESAKISQELARDQFAWAQKTYLENKGVTDRVVESFLHTQDTTTKNAESDRERYENIFQPLEDDLARDAASYASDDRKALEMGRAEAHVAQQFGAARVAAQRDLEAFGINPGASRFAALDIGVRAQQAAAQAGAGNQAAQMVDATGRALRSEAINVGRGYPGQVAGTYGTALQAGSAANSGNLATTASGANTMGTAPQWNAMASNSYAGANNSYTGAVNTMNTGYSNSMQQWKADQESSKGWGAALGLIGGVGMGMMGLPTTSVGGKLLGFADGGAVDGGPVPEQVSPSQGQAVDDVPARLSVGEFIVPEDTVRFKGTEFFYKLIEKSAEAEEEMKGRTGAVPAIHPAAMGAPRGGHRQALEVA